MKSTKNMTVFGVGCDGIAMLPGGGSRRFFFSKSSSQWAKVGDPWPKTIHWTLSSLGKSTPARQLGQMASLQACTGHLVGMFKDVFVSHSVQVVPVSTTSSKCFVKYVRTMFHTTLDTLQFVYHHNRSTDGTIYAALHRDRSNPSRCFSALSTVWRLRLIVHYDNFL